MKLIKLFTKTFQLLGFYAMEIAVEVVGVCFAYMYNNRKSLLAPILLHITFNFVGTFFYVPI